MCQSVFKESNSNLSLCNDDKMREKHKDTKSPNYYLALTILISECENAKKLENIKEI